MDIDTALSKVGGYRPWHLIVFVLMTTSSFMPLTIQTIGIVFIAWEPPHHCNVPTNRSYKGTIPPRWKDEHNCKMYVEEGVNSSVQDCTDGYQYYDHDNYSTVVTQFNLVCKEDFLADTSQAIYMLGSTITDLITSYLADSYGRKYVHILAHILIGCFGIAESFSWSYTSFVVLRTLTGMISQVAINSGLTYLMELFPAKQRTFIGIGLEFIWVAVYLLPCIIAYLVNDWRIFQIIGSSLSFIWIVYLWLIPESVSWLAANKRYKEAESALIFMSKANCVKTPNVSEMMLNQKGNIEQTRLRDTADELQQAIDIRSAEGLDVKVVVTSNAEIKTDRLSSLFLDKKLRIHLLVCNLLWFSNAVIYYGLTLATPSMGKNRFFNYSIMGLVEIPANIITLFAVNRLGRRIPLMTFFLVAGIPLFATVFVQNVKGDEDNLFGIVLALALVAKFGITGSFSIMLLYVKELFPTTLRSSSTAWCSIAGGIGAMLAPFTTYTAKYVFWLPNTFFAVVSIFAATSVIVLPETMDKPLPLTTEEVYTIYYAQEAREQSTQE